MVPAWYSATQALAPQSKMLAASAPSTSESHRGAPAGCRSTSAKRSGSTCSAAAFSRRLSCLRARANRPAAKAPRGDTSADLPRTNEVGTRRAEGVRWTSRSLVHVVEAKLAQALLPQLKQLSQAHGAVGARLGVQLLQVRPQGAARTHTGRAVPGEDGTSQRCGLARRACAPRTAALPTCLPKAAAWRSAASELPSLALALLATVEICCSSSEIHQRISSSCSGDSVLGSYLRVPPKAARARPHGLATRAATAQTRHVREAQLSAWLTPRARRNKTHRTVSHPSGSARSGKTSKAGE